MSLFVCVFTWIGNLTLQGKDSDHKCRDVVFGGFYSLRQTAGVAASGVRMGERHQCHMNFLIHLGNPLAEKACNKLLSISVW